MNSDDLQLRFSWPPGPESLSKGPENFLRLPQHFRSQYLELAPGKFVYVKGAEVLREDFASYLRDLGKYQYRSSTTSVLAHFSSEENKVPAVLKLSEARAEAEVAHDLQTRHFNMTGQWLRVPRPVAIFTLEGELRERRLEDLKSVLDSESRENVSRILRDEGMAVYFYLQNDWPHRLDSYLNQRSWTMLKDSYGIPLKPEETYESWLYVLLFMLGQNYLPLHENCRTLGSPFDKGNLCLSGGVSDLGTCHRVTTTTSEEYINKAIELSLLCFLDLGACFLKLDPDASRKTLIKSVTTVLDKYPHLRAPLTEKFTFALHRS